MLKERKGITCITSPFLESRGPVLHAFLAGIGRGSLRSLNLSADGGGDSERAERNSAFVKQAFGIKRLFTLKQVHGCEVVAVNDEKSLCRGIEADGVITDIPGIALGVLTADCLPVLLYDTVRTVAGAVHAGWRGTLKGVCKRAVQRMTDEFGSRPEDIVAVLGPHIGPCCYTVGEDLLHEFEKIFGKGPPFFKKVEGALRLDLGEANVAALRGAGLLEENIKREDLCTSCREDFFFSYRRDRTTGRQLSFIMIRD